MSTSAAVARKYRASLLHEFRRTLPLSETSEEAWKYKFMQLSRISPTEAREVILKLATRARLDAEAVWTAIRDLGWDQVANEGSRLRRLAFRNPIRALPVIEHQLELAQAHLGSVHQLASHLEVTSEVLVALQQVEALLEEVGKAIREDVGAREVVCLDGQKHSVASLLEKRGELEKGGEEEDEFE